MDERQTKKTRSENEQDELENFFENMPQEIIIDILCRLPITSLLQFTFTSRSSISLPRNQVLVNSYLARSVQQLSCFILHSDYPLKNQLHFLPFSDLKLRKIDTPFANSMPEYKIVGSSNGLLCLVNSLLPEFICLFNPFTGSRNYREIPKNYTFKHQVVVHGFGFDSVNNDYKVVIIGDKIGKYSDAYNVCLYSKVQIYSLRKNTWKDGGVIPFRLEKVRSSPGVLVNGKLHWVSQYSRYNARIMDRVIVSYDLSDDSFDVIFKPSYATRWVHCHISALFGFICACSTEGEGYGEVVVWVMREYRVGKSWEKWYTITAHFPDSMISDKLENFHPIWRNMYKRKKSIRVLCVLESGGVVMEYTGAGLILYDPDRNAFERMPLEGMPEIYQTIDHVCSLVSATSPFIESK